MLIRANKQIDSTSLSLSGFSSDLKKTHIYLYIFSVIETLSLSYFIGQFSSYEILFYYK